MIWTWSAEIMYRKIKAFQFSPRLKIEIRLPSIKYSAEVIHFHSKLNHPQQNMPCVLRRLDRFLKTWHYPVSDGPMPLTCRYHQNPDQPKLHSGRPGQCPRPVKHSRRPCCFLSSQPLPAALLFFFLRCSLAGIRQSPATLFLADTSWYLPDEETEIVSCLFDLLSPIPLAAMVLRDSLLHLHTKQS